MRPQPERLEVFREIDELCQILQLKRTALHGDERAEDRIIPPDITELPIGIPEIPASIPDISDIPDNPDIPRDNPDNKIPHDTVDTPPQNADRLTTQQLGFALGALALAVCIGGYVLNWWMAGRFIISTDDAYVQAELSIISSKIAGHVTAVPVKANQRVKAGEIIAVIDPGDLQLAVDAAKAKISTQTAVRDRVARAIDVQNAIVTQAMSQVRAAAADADRAAGDYVRSETLAARDFTSKQRLDNARADRDRSAATVASARAALAAAQASTEVLKAQKLEVERALIELQVALARAERDLDFTRIRAPVDGVIGNKVIEVGQFIQAGMRLMAIVPLQAIYVEANFKETQISGMKPGQPVRIKIDALPEHDVRGQVDSISPASGAVFSLLPPENATGNFTKIVQRVPVRVAITAEGAARERLRAGLSVVVSVDTRDDGTAAANGTKGSSYGVAAQSPR